MVQDGFDTRTLNGNQTLQTLILLNKALFSFLLGVSGSEMVVFV